MTACKCPIGCAFRWREWTEPSFAMAWQKTAENAAKQTEHINARRAEGVDMSFIDGIGKSVRTTDAARFAVERTPVRKKPKEWIRG